jgi:hypothetical protein
MFSVQHAEQLQEEDFCKEMAWDRVTQHISINFGDKSDDSESLNVMERKEDNDSDEPLAVPFL